MPQKEVSVRVDTRNSILPLGCLACIPRIGVFVVYDDGEVSTNLGMCVVWSGSLARDCSGCTVCASRK